MRYPGGRAAQHRARGHRVNDDSTQELEFHPDVQSLAGNSSVVFGAEVSSECGWNVNV